MFSSIIIQIKMQLQLKMKEKAGINKKQKAKGKAHMTVQMSIQHPIKNGIIQLVRTVCKDFRQTNISNPLIGTRTCAYQGVRNVGFPEHLAYALNEGPVSVMELLKYILNV